MEIVGREREIDRGERFVKREWREGERGWRERGWERE